MNLPEVFGRAFLRKRHSKGFGVHSPYVFSFVNDVVNPKRYGYYAYDLLEESTEISSRITSDARWYVRFLVFLEVRRILALPYPSESLELAANSLKLPVHVLSPSDNPEYKENDVLIVTAPECKEDILVKAIESGISVLALDPQQKLKEILGMPLSKGVLLRGKQRLLLVPREEMEYVVYDMKI